jgi:hypothetical protein
VSARSWRAAREGDTHAASRTSESFIINIGASGALLAGAAIVFVTLVGIVSFTAWPSSSNPSPSAANVELSAAKPEPAEPGSVAPGAALGSVAPVRAAAGLFASTGGPPGGAGGRAGGGGGHARGPVAAQAASSEPGSAPALATTASTTPPSSTGGSKEGPSLRTGDPVDGGSSGAVKGPNERSDSRPHKDHPRHPSSRQTDNGGGSGNGNAGGNGNGGGSGNGNAGGNGNGNGGGSGKGPRQAPGHTKARGPKSKH